MRMLNRVANAASLLNRFSGWRMIVASPGLCSICRNGPILIIMDNASEPAYRHLVLIIWYGLRQGFLIDEEP